MKKILLLTAFLLTATSLQLFAVDGYWEQVFPENPPPTRRGHVMLSIGERKALMIGGSSTIPDPNGTKFITYFDTWLYDYDKNEWQQVYCAPPPEGMYTKPVIVQISKNRVLYVDGWRKHPASDTGMVDDWIFDLDSMKWIQLNLALSPQSRMRHRAAYLCENEVIAGGGNTVELSPGIYYDTWKATLDDSKHTDSPYFINWDKILDEDEGDSMGWFPHGDVAHLTEGQVLVSRADLIAYLNYVFEDGKWYEIKIGKSRKLLPSPGIANIADNMVLLSCGYPNKKEEIHSDSTYILVYNPDDRILNTYHLDFPPHKRPAARGYNACAKIDDGIVMMFGGYYNAAEAKDYKEFNDTWIFHLTDTTDPYGDIHENTDTIDIRLISNNIYELSVACKAELYDMVGRNITTPSVEAPATPSGKGNCIIDLNGLPVGVYLLKYFHKSNWHVAKLMRY